MQQIRTQKRVLALTMFTCLSSAAASALAAEGDPPAKPAAPTAGDDESREEGKETEGAASEKRDTKKREFADRIKSVQRKVFLKKKRVELYPYFGLDLNDPFFQHLIVGGSLAFHIADSFAVEARGGGVIASIKQNTIKLVRLQSGAVMGNPPPEFTFHADLDASWAPLYGKISLFGEGILHFDTYLTAGPGVFGTDEGVNPAVNFGIGQRYFITDWLTARIELRNYLFIESRNDESDLQNLLIFGFSVSGFFPTSFEYEFQ